MAASKPRPDSVVEPPFRLPAAALALLVAGAFLAASIGYHAPGDDGTIHPLGILGATVATGLFDSIGAAAYVMAAGWFVLMAALFLRPKPMDWASRFVGWSLLLPCAAVLGDQLSPHFDHLSPAGGGGSLGASLSHWLAVQFDPWIAVILWTSCVCLALYLVADTVILWLAKRLASAARRLAGVVRRYFRRSSNAAVAIDVYEPTHVVEPKSIKVAEGRSVPILRSNVDPKATAAALPTDYELPPFELLEDPDPFPHELHDSHLRETAALLEKTFADFNLNVRVVGIHTGPVITQYEIALETGLRVNKVTALGDDLALNLKVPSVRIIAPIPGKNTVGIEVPNEHRAVVRIKELVLSAAQRVAKSKLPLLLGKDTEGRPLVYDLAEMPHLLIAGRTGTGKSVCLNAVILSLLLTRRPDECRFIMIDPKQVEFSDYTRLPHLMCPVVTQNSKAEAILAWAVDKMEERYSLLARARVRNIAAYNSLGEAEVLRRVQPQGDEERAATPGHMPYIVIIIDEIGDLMMEMKKEVEGHIIRLAQKSRAAGIHLILATQKPTVDVITGLIKSNLPARICFQVSSRSDSRVVLDEMGADKLLGKGDMLFLQPGTSTLIRAQGAYASDQEILRVVSHLECDPEFAPELLQLKPRAKESDGSSGGGAASRPRDPLYDQAVEVIVREGRGSVSLLQRALGIGYGKAARYIDYMSEDGIVGHYNGSQAREVLLTMEQWEELRSA